MRTSDIRRDKIIQLKIEMGGKCCECGYDANYASLDFHHKEPKTKLFNVNSSAQCTIQQLKEEATKCILLCRNCHTAYHFPEMNKQIWENKPRTPISQSSKVNGRWYAKRLQELQDKLKK